MIEYETERQELADEVEAHIEARDWRGIRRLLEARDPVDVADLLVHMERPASFVAFRLLPRSLSSEVFSYLPSERQNELLQGLTDSYTRQLLSLLDPDDRTRLFEELPGAATQKLLNLLDEEDLREAKQLLGYPEESVGRLMNPLYVAVRANWTIGRALDHMRSRARHRENLDVIYVVDVSWKLMDALELNHFVLASPEQSVESIMDNAYVSLSAFDDREKAVQTMQRYDLVAVPVVDSDGVLLGTVTIDDVLDVAEAEATEDFHKGAAVLPLRTPYSGSSIFSLYRLRVGWLGALVVVNLASSGVIAAFEETLEAAIALAFFIPLLIDSGGNTGSQSATLMVRALATGDVSLSQWGRTLVKELGVGACLGLSLGLASSLLGLVRGGWEIGLVVALAMMVIVLVANLIGAILPFILTRLRLDPAVASSPLITSVADVTGLLIYFSIASVIITA
jgi:magnesium transporter